MFKVHTIWNDLRSHWPIVLIVMLAVWLRTWDLQNKAIFFGDAAHDLWSAQSAVQQGQLPLLGIASSVPRFKQGPVTVWLEMLVYLVAGPHLLAYSLVFAAISVAAVIGVYELAVTQLNKRTAYLASLFLAVSPLAVAHGRVPYHITPLPIAMVFFLYAAVRAWHQKGRWYWWWLGLSWAVVFQFELATAPLLAVIVYIWWRREWSVNRTRTLKDIGSTFRQLLTSFIVGLAPQLLFDLTHGFAQLGGFAAWVAYRLAGSVGVGSTHNLLNWDKLSTFAASIKLYGTRIVSVDQPIIAALFAVYLIWCAWRIWLAARTKKLPVLLELTAISILSLLGAFLLHGSPSEAYYPPFLVLLPIILAFGTEQVTPRFRPAVMMYVVGWAIWSLFSIYQANFFVSKPNQSFSYGTGSGEQRAGLEILHDQGFTHVWLRTTSEGGKFPSYFQNWQWLAQNSGLNVVTERNPTNPEPTVFVESLDSTLADYPDASIYKLITLQLIVIAGL